MRKGSGLAILSLGTRLNASIEAADLLAGNGMSVTIADARFAKPLDTDLIDDLAGTHGSLLIVEEGSPGGFSAHVMTYLANQGHLDGLLKVRALTLPDKFIDHDSQTGQLASAGLDTDGIFSAAPTPCKPTPSKAVNTKTIYGRIMHR